MQDVTNKPHKQSDMKRKERTERDGVLDVVDCSHFAVKVLSAFMQYRNLQYFYSGQGLMCFKLCLFVFWKTKPSELFRKRHFFFGFQKE